MNRGYKQINWREARALFPGGERRRLLNRGTGGSTGRGAGGPARILANHTRLVAAEHPLACRPHRDWGGGDNVSIPARVRAAGSRGSAQRARRKDEGVPALPPAG